MQDRQIVEAVPTPMFGMMLKMTTSRLKAAEQTSGQGMKKSLSFHAAESADLPNSNAVQSSEAIINSQGWLPSPSDFITLLWDAAYWDRMRGLLPAFANVQVVA